MSTLENCTDALLQQKVVQSSNYERLESRLMEMERAKRSLFFGLKEVITDVERRRQDLGELREESARLQQQLQQGSVKFGALTAFMSEEQKKAVGLEETLESCATAWTGFPARVALLLRALQERSAFRQQLGEVVKSLNRVRTLVGVVQRVDATKVLLQERLNEQGKDAERISGILQQRQEDHETLQKDLRQRLGAAHDDGGQLWRDSQTKEQLLLLLEASWAVAHLSTAAAEGRNAVYRTSLQSALHVADAHCAVRERLALAVKFGEWRCAQLREAVAAGTAQVHTVTEALNSLVAAVVAQKECVILNRERVAQEAMGLREQLQHTVRTAVPALERRGASLRNLQAALCAFQDLQRARLVHIRREQTAREAAVTAARVAQEARAAARRLRALQQEAREGLLAEVSLTRRVIEEDEAAARRAIAEGHVQQRHGVEAELRMMMMEDKKKSDDTVGHALRLGVPKKNTPARVKAAALTEKKRPHGHAEPPAGAAAAAGARRTYPETSQRRLQQRAQQQGEEEDSLNSSASSLGAYLAFGTRLPLSALKKGPRSPPLQPLPTNVDNRSYGCGGKKRERPRKSNGETVVKRIHAPSPLPRPPASGDGAPCALSSALSSACARTGAAAVTTNATSATFTRGPGGVDGVAEKGKGRPPQHRPRPSVIVAKDAWGGGKTDDVFADIFSL